MTANTPTVVMFAIYLLGMLAIGWAGYKATDNLSDYILGGRSLGPVVTALSAGASDMSGWLLMGLPGAVFLQGLSASWIAIGLCLGAWLNWRFVAARLRIYTEKVGNALTLPDYFTNRFEDRSNLLRIVTALVILVFFTIYCASGVVAGARLFESMFGMDYQTALWVGAVATMAYVFIGGFLAVSWTDTIQASLMITALILAPLMVIYADGGVGPSAAIIDTARSGAFDMFRGQTVIAVISLLAVFAVYQSSKGGCHAQSSGTSPSVHARKPSGDAAATDNGTSARLLHHLYTLLAMTQSRATNIPLLLLFTVLFQCLASLDLSVVEITTSSLLLQYASFFAAGGSNAISSVDLSSAYNGVGGFNVVAVGVLTFVSNWAGPIFWTSATNLLLLQKRSRGGDAGGDVLRRHLILLTAFTTASVAFVMAACTALRTHLFIWTVFSPKYLYSMAWSLGQHLVINVVYGSLLFWVGARQ